MRPVLLVQAALAAVGVLALGLSTAARASGDGPAARAPDSHARISQSLVDYSVEQCQAEQAEVLFLGLGWSIDPEPTQTLRWTGDPCRELVTVYLTVLDQGAYVARYSLRPGLDVRIEGLVATQAAAPGEPIAVESSLVPVWQVARLTLPGRPVARVEVHAGEVVSTQNAIFGYNLSSGTMVTLSVHRGPVHLLGTGELLRDARYGETVSVRNNETGQVVEGVLHADGRVEI